MRPNCLKLIGLLFFTMLSACGERIELHSQLSEQDANEVIAELADKHIAAEKRIGKESVSVLVSTEDINRAVHILAAAGLPKRSRNSLGEIFQKDGVISTPLEERARYIYALSQELEATLSQIDGVVVARVHVVLPERIAPGEPVQPASAAVFVKHRSDLDPDSVLPRIRRLVASSIPGLSGKEKQKLAIVFVPSESYREAPRLVRIGPYMVPQERIELLQLLLIVGLVGAVLVLLVLVAVKPGWRNAVLSRIRSAKSSSKPA
jgi:type III secretion protein J